MIQLKQVHKSYGDHLALRGVDLEVKEGSCIILLGPSGCGKSTLLKTINRMVTIDSGQVLVADKEVASYQPEQLRRQIGYCIQGVGLFPHLSVRHNISVVPRLLKWDAQRISRRLDHLMDMSELPLSYLDKMPQELSGGEAQRVGVCRALAADPPILLMDEPFGAVDPQTREKLQLAFIKIQQELHKTVVFVTHDVEEAIIVGDQVAVMSGGVIVSCKTPGELAGDNSSEFVKDFLGREYPLRLLKRYSFKDLQDGNLLASDAFYHPLDGVQPPPWRLTQGTTLKEILAEMMRRNVQDLWVHTLEGKCARVRYQDIAELLQKVSG